MVHILLGELRSLTKWPLPLLCEHLGCAPEEGSEDVPDDRLMAHSVAYLRWVTELCNLVDRPEDRHDILFGAFEMTAGAGGGVEDRVARCRGACEVSADGHTANELFELGEVQKAWRLATAELHVGGGRSSGPSIASHDLDPHLHPRRLRWLFAAGDTPAEMLGPTVARRMRAHLGRCERCATAVKQLGLGTAATADA